MSWVKIFLKMSFWSVVFFSFTQQEQTISWSGCDVRWEVDFVWKLALTSSVAGPRRSSKALPKAKRAPEKGHGHCLVVCCWSDSLQLSESRQNLYIWEVCSANQWDAQKTAKPVASPGQQKEPNSFPWQCLTAHLTTNASNVEGIGLQSLICHVNLNSHQPPLLQLTWQLSAGKALPQPAGCRKCFPRVHQILKRLCHRNKHLFLVGKNVLIVMVPISINKDVLEPSYNDTKFMVWNHN